MKYQALLFRIKSNILKCRLLYMVGGTLTLPFIGTLANSETGTLQVL